MDVRPPCKPQASVTEGAVILRLRSFDTPTSTFFDVFRSSKKVEKRRNGRSKGRAGNANCWKSHQLVHPNRLLVAMLLAGIRLCKHRKRACREEESLLSTWPGIRFKTFPFQRECKVNRKAHAPWHYR